MRLLPERPARYAGPILATTFLFFRYARIAVIDMTFLFLVTFSLFLFLKGERDDKRRYFIFSAVPLGLAVMAKGPLAIVIVGLTALSYLIVVKRLKYPGWLSLIVSALVVLLIALPWPLAMYRIHGAEYLKHLWEIETINKTVGSMINIKTVANIPVFLLRYIGYYIPVVVFSFIPWSLFLPFGLFKRAMTNTGKDRAFLRSWFWTVFAFFTLISFKHTHYMLLLSPALAMIIAGLFEEAKDSLVSRRIPAIVLCAALVFYLVVAAFALPLAEDRTLKTFSLRLCAEIQGPEEKIGIVPKGPNIKKLGIHMNNLISTVDEIGPDDIVGYTAVDRNAVEAFMKSENRVFCVISKYDFETRVPPPIQDGAYILEKSYVWKKFDLRVYLRALWRKDLSGLRDEVYLISNRG